MKVTHGGYRALITLGYLIDIAWRPTLVVVLIDYGIYLFWRAA